MSFTFNWAGLSTPKIALKERDQQMRDDASAWGRAARGYTEHKANEEYADMLKQYDNPSNKTRIMEIKAEIARLEKRNEEIKAQLGG